MLGGSPAVWHNVIVFLQEPLFAGFLYAHLGHYYDMDRTHLGMRDRQVLVSGSITILRHVFRRSFVKWRF